MFCCNKSNLVHIVQLFTLLYVKKKQRKNRNCTQKVNSTTVNDTKSISFRPVLFSLLSHYPLPFGTCFSPKELFKFILLFLL